MRPMGSSENLNFIMYYVFLFIVFIPYIIFLISLLLWIGANHTNNIENKKRTAVGVGVGMFGIYLVRFIPMMIFANLNNTDIANTINFNHSSDVFSFIQLIILATIPTFSVLQSYIYNWQDIITEGKKLTSKDNKRRLIVIGFSVTFISVVILQIFKVLFIYK